MTGFLNVRETSLNVAHAKTKSQSGHSKLVTPAGAKGCANVRWSKDRSSLIDPLQPSSSLDCGHSAGVISEALRVKLLGWRRSGFSVHNEVRVAQDDAAGRTKLAGYMLRAPLSLAKMSYDAASGTVIYRSKMHLG